jgi:hypothetical protein
VSPPDDKLAAEHGVDAHYFIANVCREAPKRIGRLVTAHELILRIGDSLPRNEAPMAHAMLAGRSM